VARGPLKGSEATVAFLTEGGTRAVVDVTKTSAWIGRSRTSVRVDALEVLEKD
jgi:hypothetical protein